MSTKEISARSSGLNPDCDACLYRISVPNKRGLLGLNSMFAGIELIKRKHARNVGSGFTNKYVAVEPEK